MDAIVVTDAVRIPARALTVRAVRASGPGGQNVNKVASKVDLRVALDAIEGLSSGARAAGHAGPPSARRGGPARGDEPGDA